MDDAGGGKPVCALPPPAPVMIVRVLRYLVPVVVLSSGCSSTGNRSKLDSTYQMVSLDSGAIFFGKLEGLGTDYPVLTDVYYVQSATNPETKQVSNVLVKRGKEWHAPDRMVLNAHHIVFAEPVTAGSIVANLIAQAQRN
jgi:hypothetical protein